MEKKMETTIMGYKGTTIRIHSFIPSYSKTSTLNPEPCCENLGIPGLSLGHLSGSKTLEVKGVTFQVFTKLSVGLNGLIFQVLQTLDFSG